MLVHNAGTKSHDSCWYYYVIITNCRHQYHEKEAIISSSGGVTADSGGGKQLTSAADDVALLPVVNPAVEEQLRRLQSERDNLLRTEVFNTDDEMILELERRIRAIIHSMDTGNVPVAPEKSYTNTN